jgi:hypothetical protein
MFVQVSKLEPAWLESQAERKAEKLKQTSMHIERLQQHSVLITVFLFVWKILFDS